MFVFLYQWTPLHVAAEGGNVEVVRYLVEDGKADITIKDRKGVCTWMLVIILLISCLRWRRLFSCGKMPFWKLSVFKVWVGLEVCVTNYYCAYCINVSFSCHMNIDYKMKKKQKNFATDYDRLIRNAPQNDALGLTCSLPFSTSWKQVINFSNLAIDTPIPCIWC